MLASLAFLFLFGLAAAALCQRAGLPRILGLLFAGMALGPYGFDLLDGSLLAISGELRQIALVIILLKAGLSLDPADLRRVGHSAVLMAFVPASCEILAYLLFAPPLLGLTYPEAALMGSVLGAVSPAIVVPRMVRLMETGLGTEQSIPQLILAGASCDDIFVIVLFSAFTGMAQGAGVHASDLLGVPLSIVLGIALGTASGWLLARFFEHAHTHAHGVRNSMKVLIVLSLSFLLESIEGWLKGIVPVSGLLAVVSMACALRRGSTAFVSRRLSEKLGKLWLAAEVLLFVLVGAAVNIRYTLTAGPAAVGLILLALVLRSLGVALCLLGTALTRRERLFCMIAYLPKATVQAAIGSVPLAMGLPCGELVLSVAVLAILITAPLGAFGIDRSCTRLLTRAPARP